MRTPSSRIAEGIAWAFVVLAAIILFNAVRATGEPMTPGFDLAQGMGR